MAVKNLLFEASSKSLRMLVFYPLVFDSSCYSLIEQVIVCLLSPVMYMADLRNSCVKRTLTLLARNMNSGLLTLCGNQ